MFLDWLRHLARPAYLVSSPPENLLVLPTASPGLVVLHYTFVTDRKNMGIRAFQSISFRTYTQYIVYILCKPDRDYFHRSWYTSDKINGRREKFPRPTNSDGWKGGEAFKIYMKISVKIKDLIPSHTIKTKPFVC